jgi:hypothetical protein
MYAEMVFILERMGWVKEALTLLIKQLKDVKKAVAFVSKQNDDELWESLIEQSMNESEFISELLEHIGGHVDPLRIIKRIPPGLHIPKLRDRLVKIISDYKLEMSLRGGCNEILKADSVELVEKYVKGQRRGVRVGMDAQCAVCSESIGMAGKSHGGFVIFFCRHIYHNKCIVPAGGGSTSNDLRLSGQKDGKVHCVLCEKNQKTLNLSSVRRGDVS